MIAWPDKAADALAFLFNKYNDIDVYIEDVTFKKGFERLVNRALEGKSTSVRSVFPLGGRANVINKCLRDQGTGGRRRVYIIDADMDMIDETPCPKLRRLYRLNAYCVENLLFCEDAAIELVHQGDATRSQKRIRRDLKFKSWRKGIVSDLSDLFAIYSVARGVKLPVKTVSYNVRALLTGPSGNKNICQTKVQNRIASIKKYLESHYTKEYIDLRFKEAQKVMRSRGLEKSKRISGKTYLIPLLYDRMRALFSYKDGENETRLRLASHCDLSIDPGFELAMTRVAAGRVNL